MNENLAVMFPRRIGQSGYNKRMRKAFSLFIRVIRMLAMDTSLWSDDVWVVDSTPVECGRDVQEVSARGFGIALVAALRWRVSSGRLDRGGHSRIMTESGPPERGGEFFPGGGPARLQGRVACR